MSSSICILIKNVGIYENYYLHALFEHQNLEVSIFTCSFLYFSCNNFKLVKQSDNIDFNTNCYPKHSFSE